MRLTVFKPYGMTPKELVDECVIKHGAKKGAFSGRLDPMACGVMKVYLDDSCKLAAMEHSLSKTYRFVVVFGISTSSCDLLGFPKIGNGSDASVTSAITTGEIIQQLPIHSSFVVSNKDGIRNPLWWWALNNRINEVEVPRFKRTLFSFEIKKQFKLQAPELVSLATARIALIKPHHNFFQNSIIDAWKNLNLDGIVDFDAVEIIASVSSGFYIRQLVSDIGSTLKADTLTLEIERLSYD